MQRATESAGDTKVPRAVIVTALAVEARAVRRHLAGVGREDHPLGSVYTRGRFDAPEGPWDVLVAQAGRHNETAALETERAISHWQPDVVLLVGVAGGLKDVTVGDVVAATKVYAYATGKQEGEFLARPEVQRGAHHLVQLANHLALGNDWASDVTSAGDAAPRVLVEPIASGPVVLARQTYGDAAAIEQEGYGFLTALNAHTGIPALVVRGISDTLDDKATSDARAASDDERQALAALVVRGISDTLDDKATSDARAASDDERQALAARNAAAFAFALLAGMRRSSAAPAGAGPIAAPAAPPTPSSPLPALSYRDFLGAGEGQIAYAEAFPIDLNGDGRPETVALVELRRRGPDGIERAVLQPIILWPTGTGQRRFPVEAIPIAPGIHLVGVALHRLTGGAYPDLVVTWNTGGSGTGLAILRHGVFEYRLTSRDTGGRREPFGGDEQIWLMHYRYRVSLQDSDGDERERIVQDLLFDEGELDAVVGDRAALARLRAERPGATIRVRRIFAWDDRAERFTVRSERPILDEAAGAGAAGSNDESHCSPMLPAEVTDACPSQDTSSTITGASVPPRPLPGSPAWDEARERAARWSGNRIEALYHHTQEPPLALPHGRIRLVLHVIPLWSPEPPANMDAVARQVAHLPPLGYTSTWGHERRTDSLVTAPLDHTGGFASGYALLRTDATLEAALALPRAIDQGMTLIEPLAIESAVMRALAAYGEAYDALGIASPFLVNVALLGAFDVWLAAPSKSLEPSSRKALGAHILILPGLIDGWDAERLGNALRDAFNGLWRQGGASGSPSYDTAGHWRPPTAPLQREVR